MGLEIRPKGVSIGDNSRLLGLRDQGSGIGFIESIGGNYGLGGALRSSSGLIYQDLGFFFVGARYSLWGVASALESQVHRTPCYPQAWHATLTLRLKIAQEPLYGMVFWAQKSEGFWAILMLRGREWWHGV